MQVPLWQSRLRTWCRCYGLSHCCHTGSFPGQKLPQGVPVVGQWLTNLTRNDEVVCSIPGLVSGLRIWRCVSCGIGCRHGSDPELLWLWCRPEATAPIRPLAWEPPYAALKRPKKKKKKKKKFIKKN